MGRPVARSAAAALTAALLAPAGCGARPAPRVTTPPAPRLSVGTTEDGVASWYGHPYHGRPTSSGEVYDMDRMTAAHRTLPLGARVLVENLSNGRRAEVRINDRGPFAKDRIIDLSRAAARQIHMIGPGTAPVRLEVLDLPSGASGDGFLAVQVGAFRERDNAERLREQLDRRHGHAVIRNYDSPRGRFYRVLAGRAREPADAEALAERLRGEGHDGFVVRVDEDE